MPEGHTIHRLARDHTAWLAGQVLSLSSPQGRFSDGARAFDQCRLVTARAVGKHLLYAFSEGFIHVHLGLFGKFRAHKGVPEPRGAVRLRLTGDVRALDLTGPTDCAVWSEEQVQALRARLGPDPLDPEADPERFIAALARRRRGIGPVLLDQSVVAGIGNVYRAELLLRAGLHPEKPANTLSEATARALWDDMVHLLPIGVEYNRIITTDPEEIGVPVAKMTRIDRCYVYKRRVCRRCSSPVQAYSVEGRTQYFCPTCQPSG